MQQGKQDSMGRLMAVDIGVTEHQCEHCLSRTPVDVVGHRRVSYVGVLHCFEVEIPQYRCSVCHKPSGMSPLTARCVALTGRIPGLEVGTHHVMCGPCAFCYRFNLLQQ